MVENGFKNKIEELQKKNKRKGMDKKSVPYKEFPQHLKDNLVDLMYRICILRHKLKMIWFSINKAEGNIRKDNENTDEESKTEEMSEGK